MEVGIFMAGEHFGVDSVYPNGIFGLSAGHLVDYVTDVAVVIVLVVGSIVPSRCAFYLNKEDGRVFNLADHACSCSYVPSRKKETET